MLFVLVVEGVFGLKIEDWSCVVEEEEAVEVELKWEKEGSRGV